MPRQTRKEKIEKDLKRSYSINTYTFTSTASNNKMPPKHPSFALIQKDIRKTLIIGMLLIGLEVGLALVVNK